MSRDSGLAGRLWHALFNLLALGLLLTALLVSLGRALLPLVAEYRDELERELAIRLGQPVLVGHLSGRWHGLRPELWLEDLQVGGEQGAIHLDRLTLAPDLLGSLLAREPRLAAIELQGLQLALREDADGHWQLKGFSLPATSGSAPAALPSPRQLSAWLGDLRLLDSQLTLETAAGAVHRLSYLGLTLTGRGAERQLHGRVLLPQGEPVQARADIQLSDAWDLTTAALYLNLPQADWQPLLADRLPASWSLAQLQGGGELWLKWRAGLQEAALRLHVPALRMTPSLFVQPLQLQQLDLSAWLRRHHDGWQLLVDDFSTQAGAEGEIAIQPGQFSLHWQPQATPQWQLQAARLELAPLSALLRHLAPLPPKAQEVFDSLALHGRIENLQASLQPRAGQLPQVEYRMALDRLGFSAWHGVPAAENVSGSLTGSLQGGELRLDARDFMLHLSTLFPEPWHYREAHASLRWQLDQESFSLYSPLMQVSGDEGELAGNLRLQLFLAHDRQDQLALQVGLRNGPALAAGRYLPARAPGFSGELDHWLRTAIRGGTVNQGLFLWSGSISRHATASEHELALFFDVQDASLDYQPGWPQLTGVNGQIRVDGHAVDIRVPQARMLDARLTDVQARVPLGQGSPRLGIQGKVDAGLADTLKVLQESPLAAQLPFSGWHGEGALQGELELGIPLARGGQPVSARVDFSSQAASLHISEPELDLSELAGNFRYDTAHGLSARNLSARLFGERVRGSASATGTAAAPATRLDLRGTIAFDRLMRWLQIEPARVPVSGRLPWQMALHLGAGRNRLQVESDLVGLRIDLPPPFGKPPAEARAATWQMSLGSGEQRYSLHYADLGRLFLAAVPGQLDGARGELLLGDGNARLPRQTGLRVRGHLPYFDAAAWQAWWAARPAAQRSAGSAGLLRELELAVGEIRLGSLVLQDSRVQLQPESRGWQLGLQNAMVSGRVQIQDHSPLGIHLGHLRLPEPGTGQDPADPLAGVDPAGLPAMNVDIDEVWLGERKLGRWSFQARPHGAGARFEQLNLHLAGMLASGVLDWRSAETHVDARIEGGDLQAVLLNWGTAPGISSRDFALGLKGRWAGSPARVGLQDYTGRVRLQASDGQIVEGTSGTSALRLLGILNLDAIRRRLRLDFSDLFGRGLAYDSISGQLDGVDGIFLTSEPLVLDGPSSRLELDGQLDMASSRIAAQLQVSLPISNNLPLAALLAGAAPVAGALLIVDQLVGDRLSRVASVTYRVDGPWQNPQITLGSSDARAAEQP